MLCAQGVWTAHNHLALLAALDLVRSQIASFAKKVFRAASVPGPFFAQCQQQTEAAVCPRAPYTTIIPLLPPLQMLPQQRFQGWHWFVGNHGKMACLE